MAQVIDTDAYTAVIEYIGSFISDVSEDAEMMSKAAEDCVDNTDGDEAAAAASARVNGCVCKVGQQLEILSGVQAAMQRQVEAGMEAARKAQREQ